MTTGNKAATPTGELLEAIAINLTELAGRVGVLEEVISNSWVKDQPAVFADWVDQIRDTYCLQSKVSENWQTMPGVVAELAALYVAYQAAFSPSAKPFDQASWHDALLRTLSRVDDYIERVRRKQGLR